MTLNNAKLKKLEKHFPFTLTPEQKNILLLWFSADSKFGWTKLDFILGAHRVRRLYPDHRANLYNGLEDLPSEPALDFSFDYDGLGNSVIQFYDGEDMPF